MGSRVDVDDDDVGAGVALDVPVEGVAPEATGALPVEGLVSAAPLAPLAMAIFELVLVW